MNACGKRVALFERRYNEELTTQREYYQITKEQFIKEISESNQLTDFINDIHTYENIFYVAVDWSIPTIYIKYFQKVYKKA